MLEKHHVDQLFLELAGMFTAWNQAFRSADEAANAKRQWFTALAENNITPDDMRHGMKKARAHDSPFLPSCGQFIGWCLENRRGELPTPAQAWQSATIHASTSTWTCPAVYHAAIRTGTFELKNNPNRETRQLFLDHYADVVNEINQGVGLCLPAPTDEAGALKYRKKQTPEQKAKADKIFSDLRASLNGSH